MTAQAREAATPETVRVDLGARSYDIAIGRGLLAQAGARFAALLPGSRAAIITDENLAKTHLEALQASLGEAGVSHVAFKVPAGESTKRFSMFERLCDDVLAAKLERGDAIVALGGGVVGDLAGFVAASVRRGMNFIQVPTSLLAQVDSSVGGKTGINSRHGKNLIGAFHQPMAVLIDVDVLDDLPERELKAGYAEVIKHACLADTEYFAWLEANAATMLAGDPARRMAAVRWSVAIKAAVVAEDERETTGRRALLNFGHTFAHAYEALTGYGDRLLHGEAVALGMVKAARLSAAAGHARPADADRLEAHLKALDIAIDPRRLLNRGFPVEAVIDAMTRDKKAEAGALRFVLWRGIGDAFLTGDVDPGMLRDILAADA